MTHRHNFAIEIPEWLKTAAPNSALNLRDVIGLFSATKATIEYHLLHGDFPKPDFRANALSHRPGVKAPREWYVKTIRQFIRSQHRHDQ